MELLGGPARIHGDNRAVVNDSTLPVARQTSHRKPYAGGWRFLQRSAGNFKHILGTKWVKAHRAKSDEMDQQTLRQIAGNEAADEAAKVAANTLHLEFPVSADKEARNTHKQLTWVAATIAAVLPLYFLAPRAEAEDQQNQRPPQTHARSEVAYMG